MDSAMQCYTLLCVDMMAQGEKQRSAMHGMQLCCDSSCNNATTKDKKECALLQLSTADFEVRCSSDCSGKEMKPNEQTRQK